MQLSVFVSIFVWLVFPPETAVHGFTLQPSVVVLATRPLLPLQRRSISSSVTTVASTTSSSSENDDSAVATATTTTSEDTTSSSTSTQLPLIIVNGHNIELTSSLVDYIQKRIGNILSKLANHGAIRECDVVLSVNKNPKVRGCVY